MCLTCCKPSLVAQAPAKLCCPLWSVFRRQGPGGPPLVFDHADSKYLLMASMMACGETNPCPRLLGKDSLITDRWNFRIPGNVSGIYAGIFKIVVGIGVRAGKQVHIGFWASFLLGVGHQPPHGHSLPFSILVGIHSGSWKAPPPSAQDWDGVCM